MRVLEIFLLALTLGLTAGCKTAPSSPSTGAASGATNAAPAASEGAAGENVVRPQGKAVPLDQEAFTLVATTNQLDPQWLQTPTNFFRLGPGDAVEIEVLGETASRSQVTVGPDGKIYFGLLPGTFVWGLSLAEAKTLLDQGLEKFFRDRPQTALTLRGVNSQRIWVLGSIQTPGVYPLAVPTTLLDAISLGGGSITGAQESDLRNSFVMREGQLLPVDFYRLLRKGDLSQNIYLKSDDFVYLRPNSGDSVYVLGAVARSGPVPFASEITLIRALALSGGTVRYAYGSHVAIVRGSLTQPTIATVDYKAIAKGRAPDVILEPGDIVYVPFAPYRKIQELADSLLRQFVSSVALNEGQRAVVRGAQPIGISVGSLGGLGGGGR